MSSIAVKPVKISLLDGNRVKMHSIDAQGKEHEWVCNANHFIEFVPLAISFSNEINRHHGGLSAQTLITTKVKAVAGGKVIGSDDLALSITLDNDLQLHFSLEKSLAHQIVEMLGVQLGIVKMERPENIN